METHQTSDLRIAGSTPAMLVFLPTLISAYLNDTPLYFSLNGNVAQSVERKSHNLKVVSSILTVPTFFYLFSSLYFFLYVILLYIFLFLFLYGHMAQWKRIRLRI